LKIPNPSNVTIETSTETRGSHMALNKTINAAMIAKAASVLVFIFNLLLALCPV
jgi:hypothetical protein